ncbi:type IV secretory system conjugative DNA transfer family protein [uncultured Bradyrhizobium sp.]|uniref:type IV secretory system conjugative DNA transfer family protein n=1 Tax=uncultured Bradyrhizobium sp. TaxID=199684 RepID=UPI0035C9F480
MWEPAYQFVDDWHYNERHTPDKILLGSHEGRLLGRADDRHIVTIAGSRAGKSRSVLIPNLKRYPGSVVVIDPKGELALETATMREKMGHNVFILNPFRVMEWDTDGHDPCVELINSPKDNMPADAAQLADALIIDNEKSPHWTDSAKNLIVGLLLHAISADPSGPSMKTLRRQISRTNELHDLLEAMALNDAFDGGVQNIALSFLGKFQHGGIPTEEMLSILSTADAQTRRLDDLENVFAKQDVDLNGLSSSETPTTIYLILPAMRIATHARWLRVFIYQLLAALERKPMKGLPLLLILEEFAALGHMKSVEAAAGYFAGFGVKLWTVLQDLTQIQTHYPKSWETFLGNAGVIQTFGNMDVTTTRYLSSLLGDTTVVEQQKNFASSSQFAQGDDGIRENIRSVPLLTPSEIRYFFARETGRQLLITPEYLPLFIDRLPNDDRI